MFFGLGIAGITPVVDQTIVTTTTGVSIGLALAVVSSAMYFSQRVGRLIEKLSHVEKGMEAIQQLVKEHAGNLAVCKSDHRKSESKMDKRVTIMEERNRALYPAVGGEAHGE